MSQRTHTRRELLATILGILSVVLAGCSSGFDRGRMQQSLADQQLQVTDTDIKTALAAKPQLKYPFKLGVELREGYCYRCNDTWREEDKQKILSWGEQLKQAGVVSDMFIIPNVFEKKDLKDIRLAAAQQGADAVLVIVSASDTDNYLNPASVLYLTIVGAWVIPGSDVDALVMLRGGVWDVGNSVLYASAESEGQAHAIGPAMLLENKNTVEQAKQKALDDFGPELVKHLEALHRGRSA